MWKGRWFKFVGVMVLEGVSGWDGRWYLVSAMFEIERMNRYDI